MEIRIHSKGASINGPSTNSEGQKQLPKEKEVKYSKSLPSVKEQDFIKQNLKKYPGINEAQAAGKAPIKIKGKQYYINPSGELKLLKYDFGGIMGNIINFMGSEKGQAITKGAQDLVAGISKGINNASSAHQTAQDAQSSASNYTKTKEMLARAQKEEQRAMVNAYQFQNPIDDSQVHMTQPITNNISVEDAQKAVKEAQKKYNTAQTNQLNYQQSLRQEKLSNLNNAVSSFSNNLVDAAAKAKAEAEIVTKNKETEQQVRNTMKQQTTDLRNTILSDPFKKQADKSLGQLDNYSIFKGFNNTSSTSESVQTPQPTVNNSQPTNSSSRAKQDELIRNQENYWFGNLTSEERAFYTKLSKQRNNGDTLSDEDLVKWDTLDAKIRQNAPSFALQKGGNINYKNPQYESIFVTYTPNSPIQDIPNSIQGIKNQSLPRIPKFNSIRVNAPNEEQATTQQTTAQQLAQSTPQNFSNRFQNGDVVEIKNSNHKYGHTAVYYNGQWYSDFKQGTKFDPYKDSGNSSYRFFRNPNQEEAEQAAATIASRAKNGSIGKCASFVREGFNIVSNGKYKGAGYNGNNFGDYLQGKGWTRIAKKGMKFDTGGIFVSYSPNKEVDEISTIYKNPLQQKSLFESFDLPVASSTSEPTTSSNPWYSRMQESAYRPFPTTTTSTSTQTSDQVIDKLITGHYASDPNYKKVMQDMVKSVQSAKGKNKEFADRRYQSYRKAGFDHVTSITLTAQDALESGWGNKLTGTHNYGGIKGKGTRVLTHEYVHGKKVPVYAEFRNFKDEDDYTRSKAQLLRTRYKIN